MSLIWNKSFVLLHWQASWLFYENKQMPVSVYVSVCVCSAFINQIMLKHLTN